MQVYKRISSSPLWLMLPSLVLICALGSVISSYEPLVFDPSAYVTTEALAEEPAFDEEEPSDAKDFVKATLGSADDDEGQLTDGTWTGYAVCGEGNPHGWSPYYVTVTIEVAEGKVARIVSIEGSATAGEGSASLGWNPSESQAYLSLAENGRSGDGMRAQMDAQIAADGRVTSVDAVSGATYSSSAIYAAYADAISRAGGKASDVTAQGLLANADAQEASAEPKQLAAVSQASDVEYQDGSWTGYAACGKGNDAGWSPYYVAVTVKVSGGKVQGITNVSGSATGDSGMARLSWNAAESGRFLMWAVGGRGSSTGVRAQVNGQLSARGRVSSVDAVSGATYSSDAIVRAYSAALRKAAKTKKAAEATPDAPATKPSTKTDTDKPTDNTKPSEEGSDKELQNKRLADGTWTGCAPCGKDNDGLWEPYYVALTVHVIDGKVVDITDAHGQAMGEEGDPQLSWNPDESQQYLDWAAQGRSKGGKTYVGVLEQMHKAVEQSGAALGDIDVVSGATFSSKALVKAYYVALGKSAAEGGVEVPGESGDGADDSGADDPASGNDPTDPGAGDDSGSGDDPTDPGTGDDPTDPGNGDDPVPGDDPTDPGNDQPSNPGLLDGTYVGHGWCEDPEYEDEWDPYYVLVTIEVHDGVVSVVKSIEGDTQGIVDPAIRFDTSSAAYLNLAINGNARVPGIMSKLPAQLDSNGKVVGVDTVSGATFSSKAILEGYAHAVSQAHGQ